MTDTKPEKLTDEELEVALDEVDRRGCETRLKEPLALGRRLRDHIAALEAERQAPLLDLWRALGSQEGPARPDVLVCQARDLRERVRTLEVERDKACLQGKADHRALHDALGWAHGWHGAVLPPPWRAVTALIAERDAYKRDFDAELAGAGNLRKRYGARDNETFEAFVKRLYQDSQTLSAVCQRAVDERRMATMLPSHIACLVTRAIDDILGEDGADAPHGRGDQPRQEATTCSIPALPVDPQADALVSKWRAEQEPALTSPCSPDATSEIDKPLPATAPPLVVTAVDEALAVLEDLKQRHIPPARHGRFEDATALLKRRMGTAEKAIRDMLALWDEEGPIPSGHHDVAMMSLRAALTDAPPVFTLEEVEAAVAEEFKIAPDDRKVSSLRERLRALHSARGGR